MAEETAIESSAETAEKPKQTVTTEDVGPARKKLTIEVPQERISARVEEQYGKLQDEAVLPGFRKGRAPRRLLNKRFGNSILEDVKGQIFSEAYTQAIEDQKLEVIGEPEIKDFAKIKLPESGPLIFTVEVEIVPAVTLPSFEGIEVTKPKLDVTDEDVAKEINRLSESSGKMKEVVEGEVQVKDFVQGDVKVRAGENAGEDAELIMHQPGAYVLVNGEDLGFKGHIAGIVVDDLGKQLPGKKVGDQFVLSVTGPAVHEIEKIKGQPITITLKIEKLHRVDAVPHDKIHEQLGLDSLDDVKAKIREALESRRDRQQQGVLHDQVSKYLLENVDLSLPEGLTSRQSLRILRRSALDMAYKGVPQDQIDLKLAELRKNSEEEARKQLKLFFILDAASKVLEVEVDDQEINGRIAMLAQQQNRRPEKLRQEMSRSGEIENLFLQIREQKTLDLIIAKAKVTEGELPKA